MRLTLSTQYVRNATFTNESGQVLYKTSHPLTSGVVGKGTTTVHKVKPNADPTDMRDQFEVMGEIEWNVFRSSIFRIDGKEMQTSDFLPSHGLTKSTRTFTGPDGRSYRWDISSLRGVVVMSLNDGSKTEVARYHRGSPGIIGEKKEPCLDVDPDLRMDRETPEMTAASSSKLWEWPK